MFQNLENARLALSQRSVHPIDVRAALDSAWFQPFLAKTLTYVSGFVASNVIFQLLKLGVFEELRNHKTLDEISSAKSLAPHLLQTVFEYLVVEDVLTKEREDDCVMYRLSDYGLRLSYFEGWFNIFIGGYGNVFSSLDQMMINGTDQIQRDGKWVGTGSCQISQFDTIPKTREFIERVKPNAKTIVDFGCGNAMYLSHLVKELDGISAIGIEPDKRAYEAGLEQIETLGLTHRIRLENVDALDFEFTEAPDFILFGFVLHELASQIGREGLTSYLRRLGEKFSDSYMIVMEVDYDIDNKSVMASAMGRGYYNPYYLLHPFTNQQLLPKQAWDQIFAEAGFEILIDEVTAASADPTGFGICYVLKYEQAHR